MTTGNPDYTQNVKIIGKDPTGQPVAVALDANGNIIAVLKGEYQGALKTLATDEKGQLIAVITDPQDIWGVSAQAGTYDLTARLGSIAIYDRRGQIYWWDTFAGGLNHWTYGIIGTGGSVSITAEYSNLLPYCAKLVAGDDPSGWAQIIARVRRPQDTKFGLQFSFSPDTYVQQAEGMLRIYTGTQLFYIGARWDQVNNNLDVYVRGGTWATIDASPNLRVVDGMFHTMKVVGDLVNQTYIRLLLNNKEYDISTELIQVDASTEDPHSDVRITDYGGTGINPVCYIDDVILTAQEPT